MGVGHTSEKGGERNGYRNASTYRHTRLKQMDPGADRCGAMAFPSDDQPGTLYLLHYSGRTRQGRQHYLGWTSNSEARTRAAPFGLGARARPRRHTPRASSSPWPKRGKARRCSSGASRNGAARARRASPVSAPSARSRSVAPESRASWARARCGFPKRPHLASGHRVFHRDVAANGAGPELERGGRADVVGSGSGALRDQQQFNG